MEVYNTPERNSKTEVLVHDGAKMRNETPTWITNKYGVTSVVAKYLWDKLYSKDIAKYRLATVEEVEKELEATRKANNHYIPEETKTEYDSMGWHELRSFAKSKGIRLLKKDRNALLSELSKL